MKKIKIVFFSFLLLFSIAQVPGNHIAGYFDDLNSSAKTNCPAQDNKNFITSESSFDEEPTIVCLSNSKEVFLSLQESLSDIECMLPVKVHYSIWLPPDNC